MQGWNPDLIHNFNGKWDNLAVYGASLVLLYLASTLNHGFHCSPETAHKLELFDYCAIFLLIAGTYTPVCLFMIKGALGSTMLIVEWSLAFIGIYSIIKSGFFSRTTHVAIYLIMGWLFILDIGPMSSNVSMPLLSWLFAGALFYSLGTLFFMLGSRPIWKGIIQGHDVWHVMVLSGSACHFIVINSFIQNVA